MPDEITIKGDRRSGYRLNLAFKDTDGNAVAPDSAKWHLTTVDGQTVINSRDAVAIASPSATENIILTNVDLERLSGEEYVDYYRRLFVCQFDYVNQYDSARTYGVSQKILVIENVDKLDYTTTAPP